jgi:hypothetical protein
MVAVSVGAWLATFGGVVESVGVLGRWVVTASSCARVRTISLLIPRQTIYITFGEGNDHFAHVWWQDLPSQRPLQAIDFAEAQDNTVVNVAGISSLPHATRPPQLPQLNVAVTIMQLDISSCAT